MRKHLPDLRARRALTGPLDWTATTLAPIEQDDAERVHSWQNEPEIRDLIMGFRGPVQLETTAQWIRTVGEQALRSRSVFGIRCRSELKGIAQLHGIDWIHRTAMLGIFLGDKTDRGRGLGFMAASLILDYAFAGLGLQRVALSVLASNTAAVRLYQRLGFVREGRQRSAYLVAGRRQDVDLYAILSDEWHADLSPEARRLVHADTAQG